jgi:ABC-type antimicrobial peptide transport system permease subunit
MSDLLRLSIRDRTVAMVLLQIFAAAALLVTVAGLAAIVAFVVGRRTREIAVRLAVGASSRHIRWLVTRDVAMAALSGGGLGLITSWSAARVLSTLVYGIAPTDITSFIAATVLMAVLVVVAAWIPARRAVTLPPASVLGGE